MILPEMTGTAEFSDDMRFRYTLTRTWSTAPKLCFIGLNPSTATAETNDPTIRRCIGYAVQWGHGGLLMLNLYAFRATAPKDMFAARKRGVDIIGGERNYFEAMARDIHDHNVSLTIGAWGNHGGSRGINAIHAIVRDLHYLAKNADGSPKHPLYLKSDLVPQRF